MPSWVSAGHRGREWAGTPTMAVLGLLRPSLSEGPQSGEAKPLGGDQSSAHPLHLSPGLCRGWAWPLC